MAARDLPVVTLFKLDTPGWARGHVGGMWRSLGYDRNIGMNDWAGGRDEEKGDSGADHFGLLGFR